MYSSGVEELKKREELQGFNDAVANLFNLALGGALKLSDMEVKHPEETPKTFYYPAATLLAAIMVGVRYGILSPHFDNTRGNKIEYICKMISSTLKGTKLKFRNVRSRIEATIQSQSPVAQRNLIIFVVYSLPA